MKGYSEGGHVWLLIGESVAEYSSLTPSDLLVLSGLFGWTFSSAERLEGGAANSSFRTVAMKADGSSLETVVTVLDNHDLHTARNLAAITRIAGELTSTPPLFSAGDTSVFSIHHKIIVVKPFVKGHHLATLSAANLKTLGRTLGAIHLSPVPTFLSEHGRSIPLDWRESTRGLAPAELQAVILRAASIVSDLPDLPTGLIHGDLFVDNMLWDKDESLTVLDWETAAWETLMFDVGATALATCRGKFALNRQKVGHLLAGYREIRVMSAEEESAVIPFAYCAAALFSLHRFTRHNINYPNEAKKDSWRDLVHFAKNLEKQDPILQFG